MLMLLLRILMRDAARSRGILVLVGAFIAVSTLLMAGGTGLISRLNGALDGLFAASRVPDLVQMHTGAIDHDRLRAWAEANPSVEEWQIHEMVTIAGGDLYLGTNQDSEAESVMDLSVVRQNRSFDFLLDEENRVARPEPGTIGVPVFFAQRDGIKRGDTVRITVDDRTWEFTVATVVRDAQMNPAIVHSKRFLVHPEDYSALRNAASDVEYLISFLLRDPEDLDAFAEEYRAAGLPSVGPMVDRSLLRLLNALSEGIVAAVVILLSAILMMVALLCLRFSLLASIEEDYREIGVMKAIGMSGGSIRRIYMTKYVVLAGVSVALGLLLSIPLTAVLLQGVEASMGPPVGDRPHLLLSAGAGLAVFGVSVTATALVLRRFRRISAVEALRAPGNRRGSKPPRVFALPTAERVALPTVMGLRDTIQRPRVFGLLAVIYFCAAFVILVPVHFSTTLASPDFVSYMGIGRSDLRVDLRQGETMADQAAELETILHNDPRVGRYASLVTSQFTLLCDNGERETLAIETGDIDTFPVDYVRGAAPDTDSEIALSILGARDMEVAIGDEIRLEVDGQSRSFEVSGIYQDVTNGGRTAKAVFAASPGEVMWHTFAIDVSSPEVVSTVKEDYSHRFPSARVTDLEGYLNETMGETIRQLRLVSAVAIAVGLGISALVTALFLRMLMRKDAPSVRIMRSIGFSLRNIRHQYQVTMLFVLCLGLGVGTVVSNTLGERLVSGLWSFMGAAHIEFVVKPLVAYGVLPMLFAVTVMSVTQIVVSGVSHFSGGTR
jgi:putative ABC transport system permease protein